MSNTDEPAPTPLSPRELRRFERRAAQRYSHQAIGFRRCHVGWCPGCWWRSLTGVHRRRKAAIIARGNERLEATRLCDHDWQGRTIVGRVMPHCDRCGTTRWVREKSRG